MPSAKRTGGGGARSKKTVSARAGAAKKPARPAATRKPRAAVVAPAGSPPAAPEQAPAGKTPAPAGRVVGGRTITIEQYTSGIACPKRHKRVLRSLGLRHPHHRVVRPDNPAVRGMVNAIPHLVRIIVEGVRGA